MTRLPVLESTLKHLYGVARTCAYPNCAQPLVRWVDDHATPVLNSRVAHICAASANGPRYDATMTDEDRRHFSNLVLLCLPHAEEIDVPALVDRYPPETLRAWKVKAEQAGAAGTPVPDELLARAEVFVAGDLYDLTGAQLGGQGGQAPGAGGGGGAGVGPGARGGEGGPGGTLVSFIASAEHLAGEVPIVVGFGGRPGVLSYPGECGGHTRFGNVVAPGAGRAVLSPLPQELDGLVLSSIPAAIMSNYAEIVNGLAYLSGAGWENYVVDELPGPLAGVAILLIDVAWAKLSAGTEIPLEVAVELITPSGTATFSRRIEIPVDVDSDSDWRRLSIAFPFAGTLHDAGSHVLHVSTNAAAHLDQYLRVVPADGGQP